MKFISRWLSAILLLGIYITSLPLDVYSRAGGSFNVRLPDSTRSLTIATWNVHELETEDTTRIRLIAKKLRSTRADLYALQEVSNQEVLNRLLHHFEDTIYKGFLGSYIPYDLRLAYIYNDQRLDSIRAGPLFSSSNAEYWVGRKPFRYTFNFSISPRESIPVTSINIHAKADLPDRYESYQHRKDAAEALYRYLMRQQVDQRLIVLGDFNDDIDHSIYQHRRTPYSLFQQDKSHFKAATFPFTRKDYTTTLSHSQPIDHILISDELFSTYQPEHVQRIPPYITESEKSTTSDPLSDHYMILLKLNFPTQTGINTFRKRDTRSRSLNIHAAPNPTDGYTHFTIDLPYPQSLSINIYNLLGQKVAELARTQIVPEGRHNFVWQAPPSLTNGTYFYAVRSDAHPLSTGFLTLFR